MNEDVLVVRHGSDNKPLGFWCDGVFWLADGNRIRYTREQAEAMMLVVSDPARAHVLWKAAAQTQEDRDG
jgi:hypothetical protein